MKKPKYPLTSNPAHKARQQRHPESELQRQCVAWFDIQFPETRYPSLLLYAVPNSGQRSRALGGIMKAEGMRAGWPDLNLDAARGGYFGLRLEAKRPDGQGQLSDKQKAMHPRIRAAGFKVVVFEQFEEFQRHIIEYLRLPPTRVVPV